MMSKSFYFKNKRKKRSVTAVMCIFAGGWGWYMVWASRISHHTILQEWVPESMTYISFGALIGSFCFVRAFYLRTFNKTLKYFFNAFIGGFFLGFVLLLNCFDAYVYLFPDKIISFESEYKVVFPGPSRGRHRRCEAGLWLKDQNTTRWIQLCTSKAFLSSHRKQGMTGVGVTARVNKIGTYIVKYEFIYM